MHRINACRVPTQKKRNDFARLAHLKHKYCNKMPIESNTCAKKYAAKKTQRKQVLTAAALVLYSKDVKTLTVLSAKTLTHAKMVAHVRGNAAMHVNVFYILLQRCWHD